MYIARILIAKYYSSSPHHFDDFFGDKKIEKNKERIPSQFNCGVILVTYYPRFKSPYILVPPNF